MSLRLPLAVMALSALALWVLPARSEGVVSNCPAAPEGMPARVPTDLLRDALAARAFALEAWKLDAAGNMVELWSHADGTWLVTASSPARCSWLVVDLGREGERLGDGRGSARLGPMTEGEGT